MIHVISAGGHVDVPSPEATSEGGGPDALWLEPATLRELSGWELKPEGLCREAACVPLDAAAREGLVRGDRVDAAGLWQQLGRPVLHDAAAQTWMLGEAAVDRSRALASLQAPDFSLPDIEGKLHSLSEFRGQKVLLATWASW